MMKKLPSLAVAALLAGLPVHCLAGGGVSISSINGVQLPPAIPPDRIATTFSAPAYDQADRTFHVTATVKNIGGSAIAGPVQIVLFGMSPGVTLANATRDLWGTPYITVPASASFAPGQSVIVDLRFKDPSNTAISFQPSICAGEIK